MSRLVVDASVLIKLHIPEDGSPRAAAAVKGAGELIAPDLLWAEAGNILWKYVRRGELAADDARQILTDMLRVPIRTVAAPEILGMALDIAVQTDRTVYDSLYIAAAVSAKAVLLTADQRLVNALADHPLERFVRGLGG